METTLKAAGKQIGLNPFVNEFLGNLLRAVVASLRFPQEPLSARVLLSEDGLEVLANDRPVDVTSPFAIRLVRTTLFATLACLKDTAGAHDFEIRADFKGDAHAKGC
jgi:hypothetical protein